MTATLRFVGEMTTRYVSAADLVQRRMLRGAALPGIPTAVTKAATARPCGRGWHGARNCRQALAPFAYARHRTEQSLGVRMMRVREELANRRLLHHFAAVHHDHA